MNWRAARGWTLIEMIVVISILLLVSAVAVPVLTRTVGHYRLQKGVTWLTAALREAQVQALRRGEYWRVTLAPDGTAYALQQWSGSEPPAPDALCSSAGWAPAWDGVGAPPPPGKALEDGLAVDMAVAAWPCLVFGPRGGPYWSVPAVDPSSTAPSSISDWSLLTDGVFLPEEAPPDIYPFDPDPRTAYWDDTNPEVDLILGFGQMRYIADLVIGLYSNVPNQIMFPSSITVYATAASSLDANGNPVGSAWGDPVFQTTSIPGADPGQPTASSLPVTLWDPGQYRYLKVALGLGQDSIALILHEISFGDPSFVVTSSYGQMRVTVSSVTGRVTVEPVSS